MSNVVSFPGSNRKTISRPSVNYEAKVAINVDGHRFEEAENYKRVHVAEPIKSLEDIKLVQSKLIEEGRYRDNLLFTCGINFGLRVSDLLKLRIGHILSEDGSSYNEKIVLSEKKTGKWRTVYMNDAVMDAADLYFENLIKKNGNRPVNLNDYLFQSESHNSNGDNALTTRAVDQMLKHVINDECKLSVHASTHCMRKTFAYHVIMTAQDRSRAIEFLQKILGHSSQSITLRYAGITDDEIRDTYKNLNLGSVPQWQVSSGFIKEA